MLNGKQPAISEGFAYEAQQQSYRPEVALILAIFLRALNDYLEQTQEMTSMDAESAVSFLFDSEVQSLEWWINIADLDIDIESVRKYVRKTKLEDDGKRRRITKFSIISKRNGNSAEFF